jgi:hypothetical protein
LTVNPAPVPPVIGQIADANVTAGQTYTGPTPTVTGTQPVSWSLVASPSDMTINSSTGVVTWSAPTTVGSPHTITIRATNLAGSAEESWSLTVNPAPVPPVIGAIADDSTTEGHSYVGPTPTVTGTQPVTWSLPDPNNTRAGMTINATTGVVSWANPTSAGSPYTITIRAANAAGPGERSWHLTVSKPVLPPVVNPIPDGQVTAGQTYTGPTPSLSQGGQPITWSLVTFPSGMTIDSGTGVVTWPNAGSAGNRYTVRIRATNSAGSADASWLVAVNPAKATVTLAITPADAGLKFTVDGQDYTGSKTFTWDVGSVHSLSVASPQTSTGGEKYLFDTWSDGGTSAGRTLTITSQAGQNLTASMRKILPTSLRIIGSQRVPENQSAQYRLELTMSNGETQDVTSAGSWRLSSNEYAEINGGGKLTTHEVKNDAGCDISATYSQPGSTLTARMSVAITNVTNNYTLTVSVTSPAGTGTPVQSTYQEGQIVPVAVPAPPEADLVFVRWMGDVAEADATADPLYVRMDGDKSVTAVFQKQGSAPCLVGAPTGLLAIGLLWLLGRPRAARQPAK